MSYVKFKYLSHCTNLYNMYKIIDTGFLVSGCRQLIECDKIFFKLLDDNMNNRYCMPDDSIELILSKNIFKKEKYFFIYDTITYGDLENVLYISPYLYNIIEMTNFNKKKFINY